MMYSANTSSWQQIKNNSTPLPPTQNQHRSLSTNVESAVIQLDLDPHQYLSWHDAENYAASQGYRLPTQEELRQSGVRPTRGIGQDEWHPVKRDDGIENDWVNIGTWNGDDDYISHLNEGNLGNTPDWGLNNNAGFWRQDELLYVVPKTTVAPSSTPSMEPSDVPSMIPSSTPSMIQSSTPSMIPSSTPSMIPSSTPSMKPSDVPSMIPSSTPSMIQSSSPSMIPSSTPSMILSSTPSMILSSTPSMNVSLIFVFFILIFIIHMICYILIFYYY